MTPTPPPTPDDKLLPCKICGGPAEPSNLPTCWPCVERAAAEFKRIANTSAALRPAEPPRTEEEWLALLEKQHREVGVTPALRKAYEFYKANYQPSTDDAAVLARFASAVRGHQTHGVAYLAELKATEAAVISRMSKPEVGADDEALIERAIKATRPRIDTQDAAAAFEALRRHIAGLRAIERTYRLIVEGWNKVVADKEAAESALAACRDKVIEECADLIVSVTGLQNHSLAVRIRALATKEKGNG